MKPYNSRNQSHKEKPHCVLSTKAGGDSCYGDLAVNHWVYMGRSQKQCFTFVTGRRKAKTFQIIAESIFI